MNEFWLWFIRPIAEVLGVMALLLGFVLVVSAYIAISEWRDARAKRKRKRIAAAAKASGEVKS